MDAAFLAVDGVTWRDGMDIWKQHTIVLGGCGRSRAVLLCVFRLGLIYQLLLALPLVLGMLCPLRGSNRSLVRKSIENAHGKRGPPENLSSIQSVSQTVKIRKRAVPIASRWAWKTMAGQP